MDIIDQLTRVLDETGKIVAGIAPDQWDDPTPCAEWNVRTVVGHLVRGNENLAAAGEGRPRQPTPIADLGDDPAGEYASSAEAAKRAWSDPAKLDGIYASPFGEVPGRVLVNLRLADNLTHGWDLAKATGQTPKYDDDIVQTATAFAQGIGAQARQPGGPFAPPVEVPDDAPPLDKLVAMLGRQP